MMIWGMVRARLFGKGKKCDQMLTEKNDSLATAACTEQSVAACLTKIGPNIVKKRKWELIKSTASRQNKQKIIFLFVK
jgi:hypothetical protein